MCVRLYCHFSYHLSIGFRPFSLPLPLFQKYTESFKKYLSDSPSSTPTFTIGAPEVLAPTLLPAAPRPVPPSSTHPAEAAAWSWGWGPCTCSVVCAGADSVGHYMESFIPWLKKNLQPNPVQHNPTQPNTSQRNATQHSPVQLNTKQRNPT